jgi:hypothetical protein
MLFYTVVIGIFVFAIAWVLNKTVFAKNPAKRWVAWLLTIGMFFVSEFALITAKFMLYEQMSREIGGKINPSNPLDLSGAVIMCIIFFSVLKKVPKKGKEKVAVKNAGTNEVQQRIEPK